MINLQKPGRQLFWIVFCDRLSRDWRWWHIFLRPGYFHCYIMKKAQAGTIVFQPFLYTWGLDWYPSDIEDVARTLITDGRFSVLVMDRPAEGAYSRRGPLHCVNVVKACLGITCRALTPYQLYRALLQQGAVEIKL